MNEPKIRATTRQVAVGQGGFMVSEIWVENGRHAPRHFTFAFDCGSVNREHLTQGMETLQRDELDVLFISHLDADHVNGIDLLTARMAVNAVVLPCLDALQVTTIACSALEVGALSGSLRMLLQDPTKWFADRGVKRVLYLARDRGVGDDLAPPFSPDGDSPIERGRLIHREGADSPLTYAVRSAGPGETLSRTKSGDVVEVQTLSPSSALEVDLGEVDGNTGRALTWLLVPYVHPFSEDSVASFRRAARQVLSIPDGTDMASPRFTARLLDTLKEEGSRQLLKSCYAILSSDNNKPSLSLYSGPYPRSGQAWRGDDQFDPFWEQQGNYQSSILSPRRRSYSGGCGWLCTGDANLRSRETRIAWLRHYDQLLSQVSVFVLPHHGSNGSLHDDVIARLHNAAMVACAARGRSHHPHPALLARLRGHGYGVWQVSEAVESSFSFTAYGGF